MSAPAVREALARLRDAGAALRARPAAALHAALGDVLDALADPDGPWQRALIERLPEPTGFHPATLREGLAAGLARYTGAALRALVRAELGGPEALDAGRVAGFATTATVLGGAIPLPAVVAIAAPLALRSPVLVKPAAHDPVTAPLLARALAARDPALGAAVAVADVRRDDADALDALCAAPCLVVTGSDAAVTALRARFERAASDAAAAEARRFVAHGHAFSLALLGPGATRGAALADAAAGLALDVARWDQLGCLSPISVHVVDADPRAASRVAEALADALAALAPRLPRGRIPPEAAAAVAHARADAELRAAAGRDVALFASPGGTDWTVVREDAPALRAAPLHRFVRVHPAPDLASALAALRPHSGRIAAVASAGFGADAEPLADALAGLGVSYLCPPGRLQTPPLDWPRDRLGVLRSLARGALPPKP